MRRLESGGESSGNEISCGLDLIMKNLEQRVSGTGAICGERLEGDVRLI